MSDFPPKRATSENIKSYMTGAALKTVRESLGLTAQWVADQAGVRLRTAQYWEAGRMSVPSDVAAMLSALDEKIDAAARHAAARHAAAHISSLCGQHGSSSKIALVRYRTDDDLWRFRPDMEPLPATAHAALLSRVRRMLWSENIPSSIEFMDTENYMAWLDGRPDTEAERAAWAASLHKEDGD
ncbi:MAG: helix-turn-helix domain-containing protein [Azoarcus sp.]|nr:helix-turn-helix domain-containing protein [Azoarcus sp.]